ncbi:L-threonylcarbamoyladenylate synthase [Candidatus Odyssella acanthamoebae]|uniref:L-threonylcarbamoyladenylate synthase n=1 Tax=Candidatus Odyssella acanthamoebae TaxID=91604 RepID=UPI000AE607C0|nr:L-threonylcarbamoyladenylate synthase [Candidatus Paracaedibacter acanthamoebae]
MAIVCFSPEVLYQACALLTAGDVVAIPTETVYGLAADATNDKAVAKIYSVKQRPEFNPLIIHCHSAQQAKQYVAFDSRAEKLADILWPGPITFVLKRRADSPLSLLASSGLDTLAIRIPAHPVAQALIKAYSKPLAAPSANLSQTISPTSAIDVQASLGSRVPLIIDGGQTRVGVESTIIDLTEETPKILRPGGISVEQIQSIIGSVDVETGRGIKAPGMMARHYAPSVPMRLDAMTPENGELFLGFGDMESEYNLSLSGNLEEAAANLFRLMRLMDQPGIKAIAVAPIPRHGLGLAINDRLTRAATREG